MSPIFIFKNIVPFSLLKQYDKIYVSHDGTISVIIKRGVTSWDEDEGNRARSLSRHGANFTAVLYRVPQKDPTAFKIWRNCAANSSGPRFWCKNFGFKNGFKIGLRNGFRILTLEKVQKWEVCTCHKIKLTSKAVFKAVF